MTTRRPILCAELCSGLRFFHRFVLHLVPLALCQLDVVATLGGFLQQSLCMGDRGILLLKETLQIGVKRYPFGLRSGAKFGFKLGVDAHGASLSSMVPGLILRGCCGFVKHES